MHETDLNTVSTTDLLKFLASIMPKDFGLAIQAPQITYISNVPRETEIEMIPSQVEILHVEENPPVLLPEKPLNEQQPAVPQL